MGKDKVAVVGSGLGGLSAAIRLASAGYSVHVFEQRDSPGGKADILRLGDYRFDCGPSLLTMPFVFEELFDSAGEDMDQYLSFTPLDIHCRYFYSDSTVIDRYSDLNDFRNEIISKTRSRPVLDEFYAHLKAIYEYTSDIFLYNTPFEKDILLRKENLLKLPAVYKTDAIRSLSKMNNAYFNDSRIIQLFNRYATYNGSSPYRCPATFGIIPYIEEAFGAYNVDGGIYSITNALFKLAREKGVIFHFNSTVRKIIIKGRTVRGIVVGNTVKKFRRIVINTDVNYCYENLIDNHSLSYQIQKINEPSSSAFVFYWGIKGNHDILKTHNILFSRNYRDEFHSIFSSKKIYSDPTIYINITSKYSPSDAPDGCENWFVMVNVPADTDKDWHSIKQYMRNIIISKIKNYTNIDIADRIETEHSWDPYGIESDTSSRNGSIYGHSSNSLFSAFLRQPNRSMEFKGLYFCGGSAHPGGGMPLVVLSGKFVSDIIRSQDNALD
ncbi:MAG: phytoene desaturase family protein [bacterium]